MTESVLRSNIFKSGTKFVVTERIQDSTFGPGTTGFISYVKGFDQDYKNVAFFECVVSKRGKAGKNRMDITQISTPIFLIEDEKMADLMPDNKRKYYVSIEEVESLSSLLDIDEIDFIGVAFAKALFLHKLSGRANRISVWPKDNEDLLNKFLNMNVFFNEDPERIVKRYSKVEIREEFIKRLRILDATLFKCALLYSQQIMEIELEAIAALDKAGIGTKKEMTRTTKFINDKYTYYGTLRRALENNKRMEELIENGSLIPQPKYLFI